MTALADLEKYGGGSGDKLPGFAFKRIGDKVKGTVLRSNTVEVTRDNKTQTKLVIELAVDRAKGGRVVTDPDNPEIVTSIEDYASGDQVAVWLPKGFGIGAIADAVRQAGATQLLDGGTLTVELIGRKDTGKAKPANVYAAEYVPPVGGTALDDF